LKSHKRPAAKQSDSAPAKEAMKTLAVDQAADKEFDKESHPAHY
tara:strand:+ start:479 stop:610 length:132 start_codon:yes stop_codon:yes gene_type:complete